MKLWRRVDIQHHWKLQQLTTKCDTMSQQTATDVRHSASSKTPVSRRKKGTRKRNASINLGDGPQGDTDAPALATMNDLQSPVSPSSPVSFSEKDQFSGAYVNYTNPQNIPRTNFQQFADKPTRGRRRRKVKSFLKRWKSFSIRHTWFNPLLLCGIITSLYLVNPRPSNPVHSALFLSYPLPPSPDAEPDAPIQYGKGPKDFAFVAFYTIFLSFTREFIMQRVLRPFAIKVGMQTRGRQARFMEQAYTAIYFAVLGPFGLYVMSRTPVWYFNTAGMYEGFPHTTHEAMFKGYYLLQASYWAQQMIVLLLMLEKPRPDFPQLVAHHFITLALIYLSYTFHFTYMGLAVYITHDISDFFLAVRTSLSTSQTNILTAARRPKSSITCSHPSLCPTSSSSSPCGRIYATTSTSALSPLSFHCHRRSPRTSTKTPNTSSTKPQIQPRTSYRRSSPLSHPSSQSPTPPQCSFPAVHPLSRLPS
jgi:hypothetical protein